MRIDRDVPMLGEIGSDAHVIKMTMREDHRVRRSAERLFRPSANICLRKRQAGVDERPATVRIGNAEYVDEDDTQAMNTRRNGIQRRYAVRGNIDAVHLPFDG